MAISRMKPATSIGWRRTRRYLAFITNLYRPIGIYPYGRKMYETMAIWETPGVIPGRTPAMLGFVRIWQAADKIVYSKSLETSLHGRRVSSGNSSRSWFVTEGSITSRCFGVWSLPRRPARRAYYAWRRQAVLPSNVCVRLDLLDERCFTNGMVYLRYPHIGLMEAVAPGSERSERKR